MVRFVRSLLWGLLAGMIALAAGFVALTAYVQHLAHREPGVGVVYGGVIPLLAFSMLVFFGTFFWNLIRK